MKKLFSITTIIISFLLMIGITSCGDDAKYNAINKNNVYLKNADVNKYEEIYIDNVQKQIALPINLTQLAENPVKVYVESAEDVLSDFNTRYDRDYVLYPTNLWSFNSDVKTISKGSSVGPIGLNIEPTPRELKEEGSTYAIPVRISKTEGADILEGANSFIYVLKQVPYANVPSINQNSFIDMKWKNEKLSLDQFTVEFLYYMNSWTNGYNKVLFCVAKNGGATQIFSRLEGGGGTNGRKDAELEVHLGKDGGLNAKPSSGEFEVGKWYHIAFTAGNGLLTIYINGIQAAQRSIEGTTIEVDFPSLKEGEYSFMFGAQPQNIRVSELRMWNIVRSINQIKENMYSVNPKTEGLIAYWRMNEGEGNTFRDVTRNNPDAVSKGTPQWILNNKLEIE